MNKVEALLLQVRYVKTFLESAELALTAGEAPEASRLDAASVGIEEAQRAFPELLRAFEEARGD